MGKKMGRLLKRRKKEKERRKRQRKGKKKRKKNYSRKNQAKMIFTVNLQAPSLQGTGHLPSTACKGFHIAAVGRTAKLRNFFPLWIMTSMNS